MSYEYEDRLPDDARVRYRSKIAVVGLEMCPNKIPANKWANNPKAWPNILYPDVYHYLIKFPRVYSSAAMENFKSLEAYKFFVSGWVQTIYHLQTTSDNLIFKADVKPSVMSPIILGWQQQNLVL
ncbi:uncharacterized protein LOC100366870 [Saccoglossus kowalevskii]